MFTDESASGGSIKNMLNEKLAEKLQKLIIGKCKKREVYSFFRENIWDADLPYMQLIRRFNEGIRFLLCYWYL